MSSNLKIYQGKELLSKEAKTLESIENLIGKPIPPVSKLETKTFGFIADSENVIELGLYSQGLKILPDSIGDLLSLQKLILDKNQLQTLPDSICKLHSLKELYLKDNQLHLLPIAFGKLKSLEILDLEDNHLKNLPVSIGTLKNLKVLI